MLLLLQTNEDFFPRKGSMQNALFSLQQSKHSMPNVSPIPIMADQQIIYHIYMGGDRDVVPRNATHVHVHESVKVIPFRAFSGHRNLVEFECHDGVDTIEGFAFYECPSLKRVKMPGVKIVEADSFARCYALTDVDCDKLETIGVGAFFRCKSLRSINLPSVKIVEQTAFLGCKNLVDMTFGDKLESIGWGAFYDCPDLTRITIPLKDGMIAYDHVFSGCLKLSSVDLVGDLHQTIAPLHLEEWRDEMSEEIKRINQILPNTDAGTASIDDDEPGEKAREIRLWITSVLRNMERYKAEHHTLLKDASITLELALWKSRLSGDDNDVPSKGDEKKRAEYRVACGAGVVIPNVLSFLTIK
jgi:hypothetical protein